MATGIERSDAMASDRDRGLLRSVGTAGFAFAIVNGVVGAGIFSLPGTMAAAAGSGAAWAYVGVALVMGAVVLCFAEAGSRVPTSGGPYGFVGAAFGPATGFVAGMLVWVSCVLANGGIAAALADGVGAAVPLFASPVGRAALILLIIGGLALVNMAGAAPAARFISVTTAIKLVPLLLFVGVGAWMLATGAGRSAPPPATGAHDMGTALVLALFAFCGMETALSASGEVSRPERTIPRALFAGMAFVAILYVAVQFVAQGLLGGALANAKAPLAEAIGGRIPALGPVLLLGASFSQLIWLATDLFGAPRILFAFARDGYLVPSLGKVGRRSRTPVNAIAVHALLCAAFALTGTFERLAIVSTLATAALYALAAAAALRLHRSGLAQFGRPIATPALPVAAGVAILAMLGVIAIRFVATRGAEVAALVAVVLVSLLLHALRRRRVRT